jgi:hypothetical protein
MAAVRPARLFPVVRESRSAEKINNISEFSAYISTLFHLRQRGIEFFKKEYVDSSTASEEYRKFSEDKEAQQDIRRLLRMDMDAAEKQVLDQALFKRKSLLKPSRMRLAGGQTRLPVKPNKIISPQEKEALQDELQEIRARLKEKTKSTEEQPARKEVVVLEDSEEEPESDTPKQPRPEKGKVTLKEVPILAMLHKPR